MFWKCKPMKVVHTCKCIHAVAEGDMRCPSEGGWSINVTASIGRKHALWILWLMTENSKNNIFTIRHIGSVSLQEQRVYHGSVCTPHIGSVSVWLIHATFLYATWYIQTVGVI